MTKDLALITTMPKEQVHKVNSVEFIKQIRSRLEKLL
jgi:hypothetical protein